MNKPFIVGLRGPIGVGKTTLAQALRSLDHSVVPMSFTQPIRDGLEVMGITKTETPEAYRHAAQIVGTEVGREMVGEHHWVRQADQTIRNEILPDMIVVFDDVRFRNEIEFCDLCLYLRRAGVTPSHLSHSSEDLAAHHFNHLVIDLDTTTPASIHSLILEHRRQSEAAK